VALKTTLAGLGSGRTVLTMAETACGGGVVGSARQQAKGGTEARTRSKWSKLKITAGVVVG
jgi:hypothetical protein